MSKDVSQKREINALAEQEGGLSPLVDQPNPDQVENNIPPHILAAYQEGLEAGIELNHQNARFFNNTTSQPSNQTTKPTENYILPTSP